MLVRSLRAALVGAALIAGFKASAMEPLVAIDREDPDYNHYAYYLSGDDDLVKSGYSLGTWVWDVFNTAGQASIIIDGTYENPYNLVLNVGGNLYYVDTILNTVTPDQNGVMLKIRRRHRNNPEPGVFIRVEGTRMNPETGEVFYAQTWIKIAELDGSSIPVLKVFEGNFDE